MTIATLEPTDLEPVRRLTRDIATAAVTLSPQEARYLVDSYYQIQDQRMTAANQQRALSSSGEPHETLDWLRQQSETLEGQIKRALAKWADGQTVGQWSQSIVGIGPVLASGLLAHIDITKAPTAGHIWRFAGLDPTVTWDKGQKRPWNADLKVLCYKIGESFVKVQGNPKDVYGRVYRERKDREEQRNLDGAFAEQAARQLEAKRWKGDSVTKQALEAGRLSQAQIHARARRYAVKLFLAHWHHVAYEVAFGVAPPKPYVITHLNHAHYIAPPNWPME